MRLSVPLPGCQCSRPDRAALLRELHVFMEKFHRAYDPPLTAGTSMGAVCHPRWLSDDLEQIGMALLTYSHRSRLPNLRRQRVVAFDSLLTATLLDTAARAPHDPQLPERLVRYMATGGHWAWAGPISAEEDACDLGPPLSPADADRRAGRSRDAARVARAVQVFVAEGDRATVGFGFAASVGSGVGHVAAGPRARAARGRADATVR